MRPIRVCIYGGTNLQGTPVEFIADLAHEILGSMPAVIVTGGFLHSNEKPAAISTDAAALRGARRYAQEHGIDLRECYEAWIPEPRLDKRPDVGGAVRMTEQDGITLQVMTGTTPIGRRLAMVGGVDLVVTISGRTHTEVVVEQALELGIPVLPIPDAGGDSQDLLENHRERIAASFGPQALDRCLQQISRTIRDDPRAAARAVIALMQTAKVGKCLVLLPYDEEHNALYTSSIEPAVSKHMIAVRLDRLPRSEAIYSSFAQAIQSSSAVIADITTLNENVMYEIGYAHGRGLAPLIYTRTADRLDRLPVYFRTLNVHLATDMRLQSVIEDYLQSFKPTNRLEHPARLS
jgi:hypothetical protein